MIYRLLIFTRKMDMLMYEETLVEPLAGCLLKGHDQLYRASLTE